MDERGDVFRGIQVRSRAGLRRPGQAGRRDLAGRVDAAVRSGRKGALSAYRDATVFKVMYAWGLFSRVRLLRWRLGFWRLCSSEAVG